MIRVGIIGATGYAGIELVRLLTQHPEVKLTHLVSHSYVGQDVAGIYKNFMGILSKDLEDMDLDVLAKECDVVFTSLPHATSSEVIPKLVGAGVKVIDLSADYRYNSAAVYEAWYGVPHPDPALLAQSVYGLPELHREQIKGAQLVGNPGCYTTCSILGLYPLLQAGLVSPENIIVDAKSGVTGAGRNPSANTHFCEVDESMKAYNVARHRHTSEIEQELSLAAGQEVLISFTPHLIPMKRGILSTMYANLTGAYSHTDLMAAYEKAYGDESFIVLHEEGSLPEVKFVNGSNYCHIGFVVDQRLKRVVVVSVIDNLVKGAAGQAVQNMNLLFGLPENTALSATGWYL